MWSSITWAVLEKIHSRTKLRVSHKVCPPVWLSRILNCLTDFWIFLYFTDCFNALPLSKQSHWIVTKKLLDTDIRNFGHPHSNQIMDIHRIKSFDLFYYITAWFHIFNRSEDLIRWICMLWLEYGRPKLQMSASTNSLVAYSDFS